MKKIALFLFVFGLLACESEPLEGFDASVDETTEDTTDDSADSLIFPDAECDQLVFNADGSEFTFDVDRTFAYARECADGSFTMRIMAYVDSDTEVFQYVKVDIATIDIGNFELGLAERTDEDCEKVNVYYTPREWTATKFSTFSEVGGSGEIVITDYVPATGGMDNGTLTGTIQFTGYDLLGGSESIEVLGSFNKINVKWYPFCPPEVIC